MRARNATIIIALASLVGLLDAAVLTWDHQVHRIDPQATSTLCGQGQGCEIARFHPLSEVSLGEGRPGLPISLLAVGAYLAFLSLALRRWRFRQEPHGPRLILAMALVAGLYSCFLAFVSLMVQGSLCRLCTVLYAVNFILLLCGVIGMGESGASWVTGLGASMRTRAAAAAAIPMVAALIGGYALYSPPVAEAYAVRLQGLFDEAHSLPAAPVVAVDVADRPSMGPEDAPVHLVEFADFGCGHCRMLYAQVHDFMERHPGTLRMTFVNYPLNNSCNPAIKQVFQSNTCDLAAASECAHQQGQWAAIAPHLFDQGSDLDMGGLMALGTSLGLDQNTFAACLASPETRARVTADAELGIAAGVKGTPTFLLNGRRVVGGRPTAVFEAMVATMKEAKRP